jgi:hypothetical protein
MRAVFLPARAGKKIKNIFGLNPVVTGNVGRFPPAGAGFVPPNPHWEYTRNKKNENTHVNFRLVGLRRPYLLIDIKVLRVSGTR